MNDPYIKGAIGGIEDDPGLPGAMGSSRYNYIDKNTIVINLMGGPGAGKSTVAAGIFYKLKCNGIRCELVSEYAKGLVYDNARNTMRDQIYMFGQQFHRLWEVVGQVDVIVTDSPLLMSLYYGETESEYFPQLILEQFSKFNNWMYFIERSGKYDQVGRIQTEEESISFDEKMKKDLGIYRMPYKTYLNSEAVDRIVDDVMVEMKRRQDVEKKRKEEWEKHYNDMLAPAVTAISKAIDKNIINDMRRNFNI